MNLNGEVIRRATGETGHPWKGKDGALPLGRFVGRSWDGAGPLPPLPPEKPYLVKHPESRVREAGQNVTFCCKASGTPMPKKYSW